MDEGLRVRERLGVADVVTLLNAVIGLTAAVVALSDPSLAARLILLAAIFDAIDGIVARQFGSTTVGPLLDSVADVVSFGATPALFVYGAAAAEWGWLADGPLAAPPGEAAAALGVGSLFVVMSILRTALYTEFVGPDEKRPGIQNTLAATIVVTAYLAGLANVPALLLVSTVLSLAMVAPVAYPKLLARDATVDGTIRARGEMTMHTDNVIDRPDETAAAMAEMAEELADDEGAATDGEDGDDPDAAQSEPDADGDGAESADESDADADDADADGDDADGEPTEGDAAEPRD
jgi:CDP-diacylglycerol--serine O-phosphatidyltransferase